MDGVLKNESFYGNPIDLSDVFLDLYAYDNNNVCNTPREENEKINDSKCAMNQIIGTMPISLTT